MEILYLIQSVPDRRELRQRLLKDLPLAVIVEDDGPPPSNPWRGYQLCLNSFLRGSATHAVVVQDDAVVCKNFGLAVERIVKAHPDTPVCLFMPGVKSHSLKNYLQAMKAQKRYSTVWWQDFLPVVATVWPRQKVTEFLEWAKDAKLPGLPNPRSDDAVCGGWMRAGRETVLAAVPSLVEHPDDTASFTRATISGGKDKTRRAAWFIGEGDPLELDWT